MSLACAVRGCNPAAIRVNLGALRSALARCVLKLAGVDPAAGLLAWKAIFSGLLQPFSRMKSERHERKVGEMDVSGRMVWWSWARWE